MSLHYNQQLCDIDEAEIAAETEAWQQVNALVTNDTAATIRVLLAPGPSVESYGRAPYVRVKLHEWIYYSFSRTLDRGWTLVRSKYRMEP